MRSPGLTDASRLREVGGGAGFIPHRRCSMSRCNRRSFIQASDSEVREAVEGESETRVVGGTTHLADGQNVADQLWPQLRHSNSTSSPELVTSLSTRSPVSSLQSGQSGSVTAPTSRDSSYSASTQVILDSALPPRQRSNWTAIRGESGSKRGSGRSSRTPSTQSRVRPTVQQVMHLVENVAAVSPGQKRVSELGAEMDYHEEETRTDPNPWDPG